jgi:hypothetical protein
MVEQDILLLNILVEEVRMNVGTILSKDGMFAIIVDPIR